MQKIIFLLKLYYLTNCQNLDTQIQLGKPTLFAKFRPPRQKMFANFNQGSDEQVN